VITSEGKLVVVELHRLLSYIGIYIFFAGVIGWFLVMFVEFFLHGIHHWFFKKSSFCFFPNSLLDHLFSTSKTGVEKRQGDSFSPFSDSRQLIIQVRCSGDLFKHEKRGGPLPPITGVTTPISRVIVPGPFIGVI